ncbi:protein SEMI-ROLLED LEAF 2 [Sesamum alatum]|uniref:Protein SEMI-ROLLED LEAF 2 n=1 Tax=Sesamum alatum TaxID=300844 RepID=A0AAE1XM82_9LAMI|nr:protein SEMI-ROLLED LEAF 2 [Sesamum alatum]
MCGVFLRPCSVTFDQGNLWSPDHGLALPVLLDMQSIVENSGHNAHFLLSTVIKHLDHKNVLKDPNMQIDIVHVATSLAFPEALFHQILLAMVSPDHETRLGAIRIFSVVLVPSSVCPHTAFTSQCSTIGADLGRTLSRSASAFSSSAAIFEKLRKEHGSLQTIVDQADETLIDTEGKSKDQSLLTRLTSSYSRKPTIKTHSLPPVLANMEKELAISHLNTPVNYEAIAHTYSLVVLFSQNKKSSNDILIRSFQLALSLRSIAVQGGQLQPSRRRSLFTLATSLILFLSKAYNFLPLVTSAKTALSDEIVDPFLRLVDDCKLQAVDHRTGVDDMGKVYGSKEDDEDALKSLSAIKISEQQSTESFASMILESLGKLSNADLSNIKEQLLKDFLPDDVCPLGAQLVSETPGKICESGSKDLSEVEHSIFSTSDDDPTDSFLSQMDSCSQLTLESPSLLSVDQFMDMVSETTKEVGQLASLVPSDMPFKDMASQCEALQIGKQQVMSNFMASASFCSQDSTQGKSSYPYLQTGYFTTPSITGAPMRCGAEFQHQPDFFCLPASTPYDNFLKAAGG